MEDVKAHVAGHAKTSLNVKTAKVMSSIPSVLETSIVKRLMYILDYTPFDVHTHCESTKAFHDCTKKFQRETARQAVGDRLERMIVTISVEYSRVKRTLFLKGIVEVHFKVAK